MAKTTKKKAAKRKTTKKATKRPAAKKPAAKPASPFAAAAARQAAKNAAGKTTKAKSAKKATKKAAKKVTKKKAKRATKPTAKAPKARKPETPRQRTARLKNLAEKKQRRAELADLAAEAKKDAKRRTEEEAKKAPFIKARRGPKGFKPTEEQRAQVQTLAGLGIRHVEICVLVINPKTGGPIDDKTLRAHFAQELASGPVKANAAVVGALYRRATAKAGTQAVTAQIWWTKCRMGWKERVAVDVEVKSGVLVSPAMVSPEDWIEAAAAKAAATRAPGGEHGSD